MAVRIFALTLVSGLADHSGLCAGGRQTAFNNSCRTCHTMEEGDHRQGPSLAGVVGRKAESLPGYNSSDSMKRSGIVRDEDNLDKFIASRTRCSRQHHKPYGGITDAALRKTIVEFLKAGG